jgi:hypothetical protein
VATVFGLDVVASRPLSFLDAATAAPTGRRLDLTLDPEEVPAPAEGAPPICDERGRDGEVVFQIHRDDAGAYRFSGPAYGTTVLAADGARAWADPGAAGLDRWQRFLVAQVLPFAAVLRGLEVLHASAVATAAGAVALLGPSGAGKTSVATALERAGAGTLLADDVLALERRGEETLAHPGAPIAAVARPEAERLRAAGDPPRGELLAADEREEVSRATLADAPAPLHSLFFIERGEDGPAATSFEPDSDPRLLLASTFNLVLTGPERLAALLDVCADLGRLRVERVRCGPGVDAGRLAEAVGERLAVAR